MTLYHYIAADRPLPTGEYGRKFTLKKFSELPEPTDEDDIRHFIDESEFCDQYVQVFETELDFAGIGIHELDGEYPKIHVLTKPYVYLLDGNFAMHEADLQEYPLSYEIAFKCFRELFNYINEHIPTRETVEIYSCWSGEEDQERDESLDLEIDLKTFNLGGTLEFQEKQLVKITK